ncbi:nuclear transport factor 2 family protein [Streptomyces sp. NPDC006691]|uniref:nuclear transport factor 2 family protein n=1 Tax=Streptomyces sp. NPDC006691 TaxID=3364757 RepID=UPI0036B5D7F1
MNKDAVTELVEKYFAIWNETDDPARGALLEEVFTPDATYTDPTITAEGLTAIGEYIAAARKNFGGMLFRYNTLLTHHDAVHFSWQVGSTDAEPVASGFDVAWFDGDRIGRLYGFFNGF